MTSVRQMTRKIPNLQVNACRSGFRPAVAMLMIGAIVALLISGCGQVRQADSEYEHVMDQIDEIRALVDDSDLYELGPDDMRQLEAEFIVLAERVERIRELSSLPGGIERILGHEERGSQRYRAMMQMIDIAELLAESGRIVASIGAETLDALENSGIRADSGTDGPTWLDVIVEREDELTRALDHLDDALAQRAELDDDALPGRVQRNLEKIDEMIERFAEQRELARELPVIFEAMGAEEPVQYFVIFQNPAELRPTGGFPGTSAFVELSRGQISSYQFQNTADIAHDHLRYRAQPVPAPWAIHTYIRQDGLQIYDANWWANFPTSAEMMIDILVDARWPDVEGVIAVQPEAIGDLMTITGPVIVEVDGETRRITSENIYEEIERQRRLGRQGVERETHHKAVAAMIAEMILDELRELDRTDLVNAAKLLIESANRRDVQAYSTSATVQSLLEERDWAGLLEPDPEAATYSTVFANIQGLKTSLAMQPAMNLELSDSTREGFLDGVLTLAMEHIGDEQEDPMYEGFQRWWLDIKLPDGASQVRTTPAPANDPDASNGGVYIVGLDVGERKEITVQFRVPESERLLLRRQPGLMPMHVRLAYRGCNETLEVELTEDVVILMEGTCPQIEVDDEDDV